MISSSAVGFVSKIYRFSNNCRCLRDKVDLTANLAKFEQNGLVVRCIAGAIYL